MAIHNSDADPEKVPSRKAAHLLGIDLVRFSAALLVMGYHLGYSTWAIKSPTSQSALLSLPGVTLPALEAWTWFGWIGVEIFFVVSGFVIAFSAENTSPRKFAVSRVARLYPEAWIAALIALACITLVLGSSPGLMARFIGSMTLWPLGPWLDTVLWTLAVEISFYSIVFIVLFFNKQKYLQAVLVFIGLYSAAWWIFLASIDGEKAISIIRSTRLVNLSLLGHGCYFALGGCIYFAHKGTLSRFGGVFIAIFLLAGGLEIAVSLPGKVSEGGLQYNFWTPIAIWLVSVLLIYASSRWAKPIADAVGSGAHYFRSCGLMTYPMYMIHSTLGVVAMRYLYLAGLNVYWALTGGMLVVTVLSFQIAKLSDLGRRRFIPFADSLQFPQLERLVREYRNSASWGQSRSTRRSER